MWSNDVNLANKMESSGRPGMVHISEKTRSFLEGEYFVEDGDPIKGRTHTHSHLCRLLRRLKM